MKATKRMGAIVMIAVVAGSVLALALSATGTHDRTLVAFRQASDVATDLPGPGQNEAVERRPRPVRAQPRDTNLRDQDQVLMLLLLLEMGSPASRR